MSSNVQELVITSPEMMVDVVEKVLQEITNHDGKNIIGLSGELGSGKTTFMRTLLQTAGVTSNASSPTSVVRKAYPVSVGSVLAKQFETVSHVDAYRLESAEDMRATGITADAENPKVLLCIEWPERLGESLKKNPAFLGTLHFKHVSETVRTVSFDIK